MGGFIKLSALSLYELSSDPPWHTLYKEFRDEEKLFISSQKLADVNTSSRESFFMLVTYMPLEHVKLFRLS